MLVVASHHHVLFSMCLQPFHQDSKHHHNHPPTPLWHCPRGVGGVGGSRGEVRAATHTHAPHGGHGRATHPHPTYYSTHHVLLGTHVYLHAGAHGVFSSLFMLVHQPSPLSSSCNNTPLFFLKKHTLFPQGFLHILVANTMLLTVRLVHTPVLTSLVCIALVYMFT